MLMRMANFIHTKDPHLDAEDSGDSALLGDTEETCQPRPCPDRYLNLPGKEVERETLTNCQSSDIQ